MLGMRLDYMPATQFIQVFSEGAAAGISAYCCVPDVHQCVLCHERPAHREIVNAADYVISDSTILQTARGIKHRVPAIQAILGHEIMLELCREAELRNTPVALIGGRDDEVLSTLGRKLLDRFPRLKLVYGYSPPFRELSSEEEEAMLEALSRSGARLVFFGLGCPKQEQWMSRYKDRINASLIGVGAAFDTISGLVPSSPAFVHRWGLEWLFRMLREPRRLARRYLRTAPRFVWLLLTTRPS